MSDAAILAGWGACPVGTPDLSHDQAIRVRPVGTVEHLLRARGIATGTPSFNRPYGTTGAEASPVSSQGVPTGRRAHLKLGAERRPGAGKQALELRQRLHSPTSVNYAPKLKCTRDYHVST